MSNSYNLDDLKADLDKEFAPLEIQVGREKYVLQSLMRVPDEARNEAFTALKLVSNDVEPDDGEAIAGMAEAVWTVLRSVTADGKGQALLDAIGGDVQLGMKVMALWTAATQPGEAQNSPA